MAEPSLTRWQVVCLNGGMQKPTLSKIVGGYQCRIGSAVYRVRPDVEYDGQRFPWVLTPGTEMAEYDQQARPFATLRDARDHLAEIASEVA